MVSVKKIVDGQSQSNEWIGPFNVVFAAYCCGTFVPASFVYYLTFHLLSDRMLATACSVKFSNSFRHFNLCFSVNARVQAVHSFLL